MTSKKHGWSEISGFGRRDLLARVDRGIVLDRADIVTGHDPAANRAPAPDDGCSVHEFGRADVHHGGRPRCVVYDGSGGPRSQHFCRR